MIVVGVTSGPCVEAIDVAVCEINGAPPNLRAEVVSALSIPWPIELRRLVLQAGEPDQITMADLCLLDVAVGEAFAAGALEGIADAGYYPEQVDLIGVQGQTVRHEVREDGHVTASLDLGQAAIVTEWTGITTASHFRQRDVAAGGQGAPLIGYVDWLLLRHPERYRAVHNLDQIASLTLVPPLSMPQAQPIAFDIGPGTVFIDYAESCLNETSSGPETGSVDERLLAELMAHPYLRRRPPKTAGQMLFSKAKADAIWREAIAGELAPASILETFVAFTVSSTVEALRLFAPVAVDEMILGGRGHHYPRLMQHLRAALAPLTVLSHEDVGIDSTSKEALGVAVLAHETWHNRPCTLPTLTGVQNPTPLGCILPGRNYERLLQETWQS